MPRRIYEVAQPPTMRLSRRETQVLTALSEGMTRQGAGVLLGCAKNTVDVHCTHIFIALGAKSAAQAVKIALHLHLIV